jgi:uncharacterized protein YegJ (DUF2314 family)
MKTWLMMLILLLLVSTNSCTKNENGKDARGTETVVSVSKEDEEMNAIISEARKSIKQFEDAFNKPKSGQSDFSVKYPFETDPGSKNSIEHIWLVNITHEKEKYFGIVGNDPFYIKKMKLGDKIEFDIHNVSDWKYIEDGYVVGGKSIKYFYDRMNDDEKKQFEKQSGLKFK